MHRRLEALRSVIKAVRLDLGVLFKPFYVAMAKCLYLKACKAGWEMNRRCGCAVWQSGSCPGISPQRDHSFPYFGSPALPREFTHFQFGLRARDLQVDSRGLPQSFVRPGTNNVGRRSQYRPHRNRDAGDRHDCSGISFEAFVGDASQSLSDSCTANADRTRWTIVPKAVAARLGEAVLYEGVLEQGAMGGLRDTGRGGEKKGYPFL